MTSLDGQVIAVTGGAAGIGREIAAQLVAAGARVAIGDRDADGALRAAAELGATAAGYDLDVTSTDSFVAFLAAVEKDLGAIDVLVNNAGVMWVGKFDEEPEDAAARQIDVNLHGVIRGVKAAAPLMRDRRHGHIVTIASAASKLSPPGEATYAATKHGVYGYLKAVREELRKSGVAISVVMPVVVETELAAGTSSGGAKRLQPSDVAEAVVAVIRKPTFEVPVPGYVGPLTGWVNVLPQAVRDIALRRMVPNQVIKSDKSARAAYESRETTRAQSREKK